MGHWVDLARFFARELDVQKGKKLPHLPFASVFTTGLAV
jgi:hypothetical protein